MIKVTALVIIEETVGEWINYSWGYARDVESNWNGMAHGDAREGKWRGNWRMEWVASTLHTTSELGLSSFTTADAYTSSASSRLNWRPHRFKRTHPFRRKTKSLFYACAITFQTQSTKWWRLSATVMLVPSECDRFEFSQLMTALLMELKGNRAHWNWWLRSSQFIALPTDTFFGP